MIRQIRRINISFTIKPVRGMSTTPGKLSKKELAKLPSPDGELPELREWRERFNQRPAPKPTLHNLRTARELVKGFGIADSKSPKVIIEVFAGPGTLSRALCELPPSKMSKLIILEHNPTYLPYLEVLAKLDKRVIVRPLNGWLWSSYSEIMKEGLLDDIMVQEWDNSIRGVHPPHPNLHFVATTIPFGETGEALFNQMFRAVAGHEWLFKYGPMPWSAVLPYSSWKRAVAPLESNQRCKLTCMVEATVEPELVVDVEMMEDHATHFFPPYKKINDHMVAANFRPLGFQVMRVAGIPEWDYVLRSLWINKTTPIKKSLKHISAGARNMVNYLDDSKVYILEKHPKNLTLDEWGILMKAFNDWPFHPTDLGTLSDSIKLTDKRL
ncbi:rRNA adenine N(6)-methyltransferase {ECO:0000256/RuleBase:RU362106} {ECO:0000256/RuleBase:RU362106} [Serendipita indica DSM 11827]|uniref:rRNA adenine N(6)-methyltransferase n=1 Tax=Serendipita indica (strain DSM 11827) TaxID=1109443 RepID=G4T9N8_SERID|nr:rRNA adenine N(6)-methyltransferase {ECO:0000256/RuleBase:RU362106} {ECO:0000256/RuleBase:RU362106} [Serendipita indica DSM 11827]CCA68049.1 hypothetical protein PIIN_01916 [Serendipita indica DSM 11827]